MFRFKPQHPTFLQVIQRNFYSHPQLSAILSFLVPPLSLFIELFRLLALPQEEIYEPFPQFALHIGSPLRAIHG